MHREVQFRAQADATRLMDVFTRACTDLEDRCEGVERPLREQQGKYEDLQRRYRELEEQRAGLEVAAGEQNVQSNVLEMERDQYISDLEAQREETESHERRIEELLLALQQAQEEANQLRRDARNEVEAAGLQHAAALARKDEELEEVHQQRECYRENEKIAAAELVRVQADRDRLQQTLQAAHAELEQAERSGGQHKDKAAQLQQEVETLIARVNELSSALSAAQDGATAQRDAFERDLGDLRQQADADFANARSKHEEKLADLTRTCEENVAELRVQLAEVQDDVGQAREQHRADIEQWESELGENQKKVSRCATPRNAYTCTDDCNADRPSLPQVYREG